MPHRIILLRYKKKSCLRYWPCSFAVTSVFYPELRSITSLCIARFSYSFFTSLLYTIWCVFFFFVPTSFSKDILLLSRELITKSSYSKKSNYSQLIKKKKNDLPVEWLNPPSLSFRRVHYFVVIHCLCVSL